MTALPARGGIGLRSGGRLLRRSSGLLIAVATLLLAFGVLDLKLAHGFGYFDLASTASSATTLALAAIGETIVIIAGGLDLSAGAVISLSNCLVAAHLGPTPSSMILWTLLGVLAGTIVGAVNGFCVVALRLQPIIVTLATMFIVEGITLFVLDQPGGALPPDYSQVFVGDAIPGLLPTPVLILGIALLIWAAIKLTRFGPFLYAVGSSPEAARSKGVPVGWTSFGSYVIAGTFYGAGGVFLAAQTGSGDPTVGPPMLLPIFVAIVLGGTTFVGGRGGALGTVLGAFTLMLIVNLLLVFNVPTFYSTVAEGGLLILAMLGGAFGRDAPIWRLLRGVQAAVARWRDRRRSGGRGPSRVAIAGRVGAPRADDTLPGAAWRRWIVQHGATLRYVLPSYLALMGLFVVTFAMFGSRLTPGAYSNALVVLSSFTAVLALGQGAVVISGGLDLSMPAIITFSGILLAALSRGSDAAAVWVLPTVLGFGIVCGALNGVGVVALGIDPLIMTLAMNGILQGFALVYSNGTPAGTAPPSISWLMTGKIAGMTPVVLALACFVVLATLLLSRTTFGRRLLAVGNSRTVALYSGVPVERTLVATFALSGFCSALVGIMLVGFTGQAFNDMGDPYLLSAIAVVLIGGTLMTGGRGHYLGMFGGALLLTALTMILNGLAMPASARDIIFGSVILAAVFGLRERTE